MIHKPLLRLFLLQSISCGLSSRSDRFSIASDFSAWRKKVLLPKPYYYSYPHNVKLAGMQPVFTDLEQGKINIDDFVKKIEGCAAVLINSPSNPTGRVQEVETLKEIERITQKKGAVVISDEVYKDIIYGRENYLIQGPHVVTVNSFSKTYSMCGDRVGFLWSLDQSLVDEVMDMKSHTSMNTNVQGQRKALAAARTDKKYVRQGLAIWRERRDMIVAGMRKLSMELWEPEGAFYVLPKFPGTEKNDKQIVCDLFNNHQVITYPGSWFGAPGRVRFSYALNVDKIEEGLGRVKDYIEGRK